MTSENRVVPFPKKEGKNMGAKKSTARGEPVNGDSFQVRKEDGFTRNTTGCCEKGPGIVTAMVLHYIRCSGLSLEHFRQNDTFS